MYKCIQNITKTNQQLVKGGRMQLTQSETP